MTSSASSFRGLASKRTDRRMRAAGIPAHARAREIARRGLEATCVDPSDRVHDDAAAALEVFLGQQALPVFLEAGRQADAEDDLPDRAPHPLLRVPEREEARLESERIALVIEAEAAGEVVEGELHVVELGPEVRLVSPAHALAAARLVVDHLDQPVADVVDAVDLADDLDSVELEMEALLERDRAEAPHPLHAGDEADVVAEHVAHLVLFAPAV